MVVGAVEASLLRAEHQSEIREGGVLCVAHTNYENILFVANPKSESRERTYKFYREPKHPYVVYVGEYIQHNQHAGWST